MSNLPLSVSIPLEVDSFIRDVNDPNLIPENIKAGVTILGVTGTYEGTEEVGEDR